MTAYYNARRLWKFGFLTGIFVQDRIFVIIIIQFGGNLFRYYLVYVRQIYNHFRYRYRELRPFIIVLVIIIVNENITDLHTSAYSLVKLHFRVVIKSSCR